MSDASAEKLERERQSRENDYPDNRSTKLEINFALQSFYTTLIIGVLSALRTRDFIEITNYPSLLSDEEFGINYDKKRIATIAITRIWPAISRRN